VGIVPTVIVIMPAPKSSRAISHPSCDKSCPCRHGMDANGIDCYDNNASTSGDMNEIGMDVSELLNRIGIIKSVPSLKNCAMTKEVFLGSRVENPATYDQSPDTSKTLKRSNASALDFASPLKRQEVWQGYMQKYGCIQVSVRLLDIYSH
jgi:hypothetical protein